MVISLDKIKAALRDEDVEGYIKIHGTPDDEYDSEAEEIALRLQTETLPTEDRVLDVLAQVWARCFNLDEEDLQKRMPRLKKVATTLLQDKE